jgi:hypothetical protein
MTRYTPSQGERALLSLVGRLADVQRSIKDESVIQRRLIAILDEADSTFHPEWQRRFVNCLMEITAAGTLGNGVQFLLSTHAPLLLSDIPHEWSTCLKPTGNLSAESQERNTTTEPPKRRTFAGNLYDLLNDEFYLEQGFIGELAQKKIGEVIGPLRHGSGVIPRETQVLVEKLISIVADPVIKSTLSSALRGRTKQDEPTRTPRTLA